MYTAGPKKMLNMHILEILKNYTDQDHRLSQREIAVLLERDYQMKADRKSIKRNLTNLLEAGFDLEYSEVVRTNKHGEQELMLTDWYLNRDFNDAELRLLIDSVLFSKHLPYRQCRSLIQKIEGLSNIYFKSKVKHVRNLPENKIHNKQLFYNIEILDEAISKGKQVEFLYNSYGTDKKMTSRLASDGIARTYTINPYQMVATNGRYYLICNYDKYDNVANYRVDRITNIKLLDSPIKPSKQVKGLEHGFDLPKHMAEHIYMFTGESKPVTFTAKNYLIGELVDWFGNDIEFSNQTEQHVTAKVQVNLQAMRCFALQYARHLTITNPPSLVEEVKQDLREAVDNYGI